MISVILRFPFQLIISGFFVSSITIMLYPAKSKQFSPFFDVFIVAGGCLSGGRFARMLAPLRGMLATLD